MIIKCEIDINYLEEDQSLNEEVKQRVTQQIVQSMVIQNKVLEQLGGKAAIGKLAEKVMRQALSATLKEQGNKS